MQFSSQAFLFLLFCCTAQPASSVSASEKWPWSKKKAAPAPVAEAPVQKAEPAPAPDAQSDDVLGELTQPGCYMRMSSGCPKTPMRTELWRHDAWAESQGLDKEGCQLRKEVWNKYCDATDAQMAFVANQTRSEPLSALQISARWQWPWSKKKAAAKPAPTPVALKQEKAKPAPVAIPESQDIVVDTEEPGCYLRMLSGCPQHPLRTEMTPYGWRHDTWAESRGLDEARCQQRAIVWNEYCGAQDAVMAFVPQH